MINLPFRISNEAFSISGARLRSFSKGTTYFRSSVITLAKLIIELRKYVAPLEKDRSLAPDIEKASLLIRNGKLIKTAKGIQFPKLDSR